MFLNKYKKIQEQVNLIGISERIREVVELIIAVAPTNISVLITGESGVGKEVVAKAIHQISPRKTMPMLSVNCGAIPEGLLESELFGHEKGAFTGAVSTKKGYFELADKGTLLLDEIGETPLQTQVKLLRVLESGEFMRVGSGELRKVDVRVITATNRDLAVMVKNNQFRKDLFYRLKTVTIEVPPLRERREDIPLLLEYFIQQTIENNNIVFNGFSDGAMEIIREYDWPGNIRELKNFVESIVVLSAGKKIEADMVKEQLTYYEDTYEIKSGLPMHIGTTVEQAERELIYKALLSLGVEIRQIKQMLMQIHGNSKSSEEANFEEQFSFQNEILPLAEREKQIVREAMIKFHGNKRKAADALNISERTLYRKLREHGLD